MDWKRWRNVFVAWHANNKSALSPNPLTFFARRHRGPSMAMQIQFRREGKHGTLPFSLILFTPLDNYSVLCMTEFSLARCYHSRLSFNIIKLNSHFHLNGDRRTWATRDRERGAMCSLERHAHLLQLSVVCFTIILFCFMEIFNVSGGCR